MRALDLRANVGGGAWSRLLRVFKSYPQLQEKKPAEGSDIIVGARHRKGVGWYYYLLYYLRSLLNYLSLEMILPTYDMQPLVKPLL
jgi:hypothetical protein